MDVMEKAGHRRGRFTRRLPFRSGALVVLGCSLAALLAGSASAIDPTFTQASGSPIASGSGAISVVAANLNGAGGLDLAVANQNANNVRILLGSGTGTFSNAAGSPVAVGTDPVGVVAADLDGDGDADLAVANENAAVPGSVGSVSILLGSGTGTFSNAAGSPIAVGGADGAPQSIAVADLNGAGGLDLAVANEGADNVAILLGDGTGGFSAAAGVPLAAGALPQSVATADFNGDGKTDLATANEGLNNVTILLGNGSGGFPTSSAVAAGTGPSDVGDADLNGDGKPDLMVANGGANTVSILLGNGAGSFPTSSTVAVGSTPEGVAAADLNGDGKLDLAVANAGGTDVSILVGNGLGGFSATASSPVPAGTDPTTVAPADLNGDTKPDLAVANYVSNNVTVLLNTTPSAPPTAVTLRGFVARATQEGVELRWRTAQETGLLGFEVYRAGVKLNRTLIAARGPGAAGSAYRFLDRNARIGAASTYRLRAVRGDGTRAWIGRTIAKG